MKVKEALKSINAYPIPLYTIQDVADSRGIDLEADADAGLRQTTAFRLAKADVLKWLSEAPNISQAGISYSFTEEERRMMRRQAQSIYNELGVDGGMKGKFGYMGERF